MEKVKKLKFTKSILLATLLLVCAVFLTACGGGTPIERSESLTALSNTFSTEALAEIGDYRAVVSYDINSYGDELVSKINQSTTLEADMDNMVAYSTNSLTASLTTSGAVEGVSTSDFNMSYYIGAINGSNYMVNTEKLAYSPVTTSLEDYISYQSMVFGLIQVVDDNMLASVTVTREEHSKINENSFNIYFEITATEESQTTNGFIYYEIRDGRLTKYEHSSSTLNGETLTYENRISIEISYSEYEFTMPTSLEGYTETSFDLSI